MKKILVFLLFFAVFVRPSWAQSIPDFIPDRTLPGDIVFNNNQGLGVCHSINNQAFRDSRVSWGYDSDVRWSDVEPEKGIFNFSKMDAIVDKAKSAGKKIWLAIYTVEDCYPSWLRDEPNIRIGPRNLPVPWNETLQNHIGHLVHEMARHYDNEPTIEAVVVSGLGYYTETHLDKSGDVQGWLDLGYNDDLYRETIEKFVDIYLGKDYVLPDGSVITGFQKKPVVLHLGSGLEGHLGAILVYPPDGALVYILREYGMRVWLKYNGWGCSPDESWCVNWLTLFNNFGYSSQTRVGFEPGFGIYPGNPGLNPLLALQQHTSINCLQDVMIQHVGLGYDDMINDLAKYSGSQIIYRGGSFSYRNGNLNFSLQFINRGTTPLFRPRRNRIKDEVASFDIQISLVDKDGQVVFSTNFTPNPPTQEWYGNQEKTINGRIFIPGTIIPGSYDIFLSLINPDLGLANYADYFKLINTELEKNDQNMYKIGSIEIREYNCPRKSLGNLNCDEQGLINTDDLNILLGCWSPATTVADPADLNGDARVDEKDLSILLANWETP